MPRVTWATRDDWLRFYRVWSPTGAVTMGDDRTWAPRDDNPELLRRADALIALGIVNPARVVVCGCGPGGFLIEALKLRGITNVWGIDSSPWVQSRRDVITDENVTWLNADFTGNIANALRGLTGDRGFDWVITESVFESYDDNEVTVGLNACEGLRSSPATPMSQIVHLVYTPPFDEPGVFNEHAMAEWRAMRPAHTWMNAEGYEVQA